MLNTKIWVSFPIRLWLELRYFCLFNTYVWFVIAVGEYVKSLSDGQNLEDKLSHRNFICEGKTALFPSHLTPTEILAGVKAKKLLQGAFLASRENFLEGQVNVEGYDKPVTNFLL